MDYWKRQVALQNVLGRNRLDAILITHPPNIRYLCGFTGSSAALLVNEDKNFFFSDGRYSEQARNEVQGAKIVIGKKAAIVLAAEWLNSKQRQRLRFLGLEAEHLTMASYDRIKKQLPSIRLKAAPPLVETARMIKDAEELLLLRKAVHMGADLFDKVLPIIKPGIKEIEIAAEMEFQAHKAGAQEMSFPTIIASGERSALPHGRASNAVLPDAGLVVCDFGVILAGYCSDQTRTIGVGKPSAEARRAYDAVKDAQQAAVDAVRPGSSFADPDLAARKLLKARGLAKFFTHSTGHGVGLEIHENPRLAAGQSGIFQPGMVVTIEPGVYVPGKFGVRIEDMVLVTERGCEVLTPSSKEWLVH
jgi:Xaa-Pro aminopeptidase